MICPNCKTTNIAEILYGLPDFDEIEDQVNAGKIVLAGCTISGITPDYMCNECFYQWKKDGRKSRQIVLGYEYEKFTYGVLKKMRIEDLRERYDEYFGSPVPTSIIDELSEFDEAKAIANSLKTNVELA